VHSLFPSPLIGFVLDREKKKKKKKKETRFLNSHYWLLFSGFVPKELSNFISFVICKFVRFESKLFVLSPSLHISTCCIHIGPRIPCKFRCSFRICYSFLWSMFLIICFRQPYFRELSKPTGG
jgi:hypothetical protein